MRIATWNITGLRARLGFFQHWLRERQPEVVGLQELKLSDDHFPHQEIEELGYRAVTYGQKSWNGVAILSRMPLEIVHKGLPGPRISARAFSPREPETSASAAFTARTEKPSSTPTSRSSSRGLDALADHFERCHTTSEPLVLGGDFNLCPAPLDSWNETALAGHIFHTDAERTRFRRLLDWGFEDVYRKLFPETQTFSWWDYRAGAFHKKQDLRIDFLLATRSVMQRVRGAEIDREYRKKKDGLIPSDHAPVFFDME